MHTSNLEQDSITNSQSDILIEIEVLVKYIQTAYQPLHMSGLLHGSDMYFPAFTHDVYQSILDSLPRYLSVYSPHFLHHYYEHHEAFWHGCSEIGLFVSGEKFIDSADVFTHLTVSCMHKLVAIIAKYTQSLTFRRRVGDRRHQMAERLKSLIKNADATLQLYERTLVVRVDFGYLKANQHLIDVDMMYQHLDQFKAAMSKHPEIFKHLINLAWVAEQGRVRGYHFHLAFYFKGSKVKDDWYKAKQIGELWIDITGGLGSYHNCNTASEKAKFRKWDCLGIGMVFRSDLATRQKTINSVSYLAKLAKEDQYLRMRPKARRAFYAGNPQLMQTKSKA
jgi:hypothetical protein